MLLSALREHFGFSAFNPGQEAVIAALVAGKSSLALFPTGAGKSLCYQLPALLRKGTALVISPLIALMKDQVDALKKRGIAAARLDSSLGADEAAAVLESLQRGELKLLYIAPERLTSETFVERLRRTKISLLAIDEAHCISEWGHSFRPEYLRLAKVARELKLGPILALTATATPSVAKEICDQFGIEDAAFIKTPFHRPNLQLKVTPIAERERLERLATALQSRKVRPSVVYVTLQETAERVATFLQKQGLKARAYHAGLPEEQRTEAQEAFMEGAAEIIVATIAFGMGIDKADIRSVFHFNMPKSIENYLQEIGRSGRDGQPALCEWFACRDDRIVLENFIFGDTPTLQAVRQLVDLLLRQGEEYDISTWELSGLCDMRPLIIEIALTHLELDGLLQPLGQFYSAYQIQLRHPLERIVAGHTAERQRFLRAVFNAAKVGRKYLSLNLTECAEAIGETRERIVKALNWLEESGDLTLHPSGVRQRFRLLAAAREESPDAVARRLMEKFTQREARDLDRLTDVMTYAEHPGCQTQWLLGYFGEVLEAPCGHCGACLDPGAARDIPGATVPEISPENIAMIGAVRREGLSALRSPRQLARFLCGISSPAASRLRLSRHEHFGALREVPFQNVLDYLESLAW